MKVFDPTDPSADIAAAKSRGGQWCAIGIERGKHAVNIGTLWRSAACLGASYIFCIGDRYTRSADTVYAPGTVPFFTFDDTQDFAAHLPYGATVVGVELTDDALSLETFTHPRNAIYLLGPEDNSLSSEAQALCSSVVKFHSRWCLNVAMAGTIVLYDRQAKAERSANNQITCTSD